MGTFLYIHGPRTLGQEGSSNAIPFFGIDKGPIIDVAIGEKHALVILEGGDIYSWGDNSDGQLGHNDLTARRVPTLVEYFKENSLKGVRVSCSARHSCVLADDGFAYTFGSNEYGQLGLGQEVKKFCATPSLVSVPPPDKKRPNSSQELPLAQVCLMDTYSFFLTESGELYSCGSGEFGRLGYPKVTKQWTPKVVCPGTPLEGKKVVGIACGLYHGLAVTDEGMAYSWGYDIHLQLGVPRAADSNSNNIPVQAIEWFSSKGLRVVAVETGTHSSAALTDDGQVFQWGRLSTSRKSKEIQTVSQLEGLKVVSLRVSNKSFVATTSEGATYMWGNGKDAQMVFGQEEGVGMMNPKEAKHFADMKVTSVFTGNDSIALVAEEGMDDLPSSVFDRSPPSSGRWAIARTTRQLSGAAIASPAGSRSGTPTIGTPISRYREPPMSPSALRLNSNTSPPSPSPRSTPPIGGSEGLEWRKGSSESNPRLSNMSTSSTPQNPMGPSSGGNDGMKRTSSVLSNVSLSSATDMSADHVAESILRQVEQDYARQKAQKEQEIFALQLNKQNLTQQMTQLRSQLEAVEKEKAEVIRRTNADKEILKQQLSDLEGQVFKMNAKRRGQETPGETSEKEHLRKEMNNLKNSVMEVLKLNERLAEQDISQKIEHDAEKGSSGKKSNVQEMSEMITPMDEKIDSILDEGKRLSGNMSKDVKGIISLVADKGETQKQMNAVETVLQAKNASTQEQDAVLRNLTDDSTQKGDPAASDQEPQDEGTNRRSFWAKRRTQKR